MAVLMIGAISSEYLLYRLFVLFRTKNSYSQSIDKIPRNLRLKKTDIDTLSVVKNMESIQIHTFLLNSNNNYRRSGSIRFTEFDLKYKNKIKDTIKVASYDLKRQSWLWSISIDLRSYDPITLYTLGMYLD